MLLSTLAVTCFFASAIGVGLFVRVASRARWLDVPNERSSHDVPTPLGAGVVIVIVASAALAWAAHAGLFDAGPTALATLIVAGISAVDDFRSLPSALRLIVHVACAVTGVLTVADAGPRDWSVPLMILAVIWIRGLTNAYNFMDGIDGISGSQAVVAGVAFSLSALHIGLTGPAVAGLAIAAASAGFLVHNWPPARVFMGDVGSAFLGFSFAAMAVQIASWSFASAAAAVLSLWPFVFDATLTFLRRALRGENFTAVAPVTSVPASRGSRLVAPAGRGDVRCRRRRGCCGGGTADWPSPLFDAARSDDGGGPLGARGLAGSADFPPACGPSGQPVSQPLLCPLFPRLLNVLLRLRCEFASLEVSPGTLSALYRTRAAPSLPTSCWRI